MNIIKYCSYTALVFLMSVCGLSYGQTDVTANDLDGDGIINTEDNCSAKSNLDQLDSDNDGFGNVCDADFDNNNIVDNTDASIFYLKLSQLDLSADLDGDGEIGFGDIETFLALQGLPPGPGAIEEVEETPLATVSGRVVDTAGMIIANSSVTPFEDGIALDVATNVDSNGGFSLELPAETSLSLLVSAPNYANQVVAVISPAEGGVVTLSTTLIQRGDIITVSDEGVNTYTGGVGAEVTFDKADFVDENGAALVGDIELTITPVDVSKPATLAAFPGSFSGVAEGDEEPSEIISLGTVEYHFTQNGNPINLAPGKTANVLLPIYVSTYQDGTGINIGDSIPLWSLNEDTGVWLQEGFGEVVASENSTTGLAMQAVVSHFSWWNVDIIAQVAEVEITVLGESEGDTTIIAKAELSWGLATTGVRIGGTTDRLRIPAGTKVCFFALILYDTGSASGAEDVCVTANPGEVHAITLTGLGEGELDVVTDPIGVQPDVLNVYTAINYPVPVSIFPLSAEESVSYVLTSGALPNGLSVDSFEDVKASIVGTPTVAGTFEFTITATDSQGYTDTIDFKYFVQDTPYSINLSFTETEQLGLAIGLYTGTATVDWNDGSTPEVISYDETNSTHTLFGLSYLYTSVYHEYSSPRAGNVTVSFSDGYDAVKVIGTRATSSSAQSTFNFDLFELSELTRLLLLYADYYSGPITGEFSSIPRSVKSVDMYSNLSSVTGDASDLPVELVGLRLRGSGSGIGGDTSDLPRSLEYIYNQGYGAASISGDIANLPSGLNYFYYSSNNTISGDIASLASTPSFFYLYGSNTVTGNTADIPGGISSFYLSGQNTLSGNVASIPTSISTFYLFGQNTLSGNVASIPTSINTLNIGGSNTVTGDIAGIPVGVSSITVSGYNTLFGDVANLSSSMRSFNIYGQNTISGDIGDLRDTLSTFRVYGSNTVTGNISDMPSTLFYFYLTGNNTVSGDLGLLTANNLYHLYLGGSNTVDMFSEAPVWEPTRLTYLNLVGGGASGFDAVEVDRLLIHLDEYLEKQDFQRSLYIRRAHDEAPTAASTSAIESLASKNYNVYTN